MSEPIEKYLDEVTRIVIIPVQLEKGINEALAKAFENCPAAAKDKDQLFQQLLHFFDQYGYIPEFEVEKKHDD